MDQSTSSDAATHPAARPAASFVEALDRVEALQAKDGPDVREDSRTRLWFHSRKTERSLVYYHGYTNAPPQFKLLGEDFYQRGYNVLVPRLPYHGLSDPLTTEQAKLKAADLVQLTQETVDIAQGLGEKVTIVGLSAGGVMAAWAAQFRADIDLAVSIAPALGLPFVPAWVSTGARKMVPYLPNYFIWWDPRVKEKVQGPPHGYPRFSTHGLMELIRLGKTVTDAARTTPPATRRIVMVTSACDTAVHNPTDYKLAATWRAHGADVQTYEFAKDQQIIHDMIDPMQTAQRTDIVYPVLIDLITK